MPNQPSRFPLTTSHSGGEPILGEARRFVVVGLGNVCVDLSVYSLMLLAGAGFIASKAVAFACGTLFAFLANKSFTFRSSHANSLTFVAFIAIYAATMLLNVGMNSLILALAGTELLGRAVAYCGAVGTSACVNFFGMRALFHAAQTEPRQ